MKDNNINNLFNMINLNLKTFIKFELLYKLILCIVFVPVSISSFNMILNITGFKTINLNNIFQVIINPMIISFFLIILILIIIATLYEISTIIVIQDLSYHNKKLTLKEAIKISTYKFKNIFKEGNSQNIFYLLLLAPFLNVSIITGVLLIIDLSSSITNFINANINVLLIVFLLYILLIALLSDRLFTLHYTIIEDLNIDSAKKKSNKLIKNRVLKDHYKIFITQLVLTATAIGFTTIGGYLLPTISTMLNNIPFLVNNSELIIMFTIILFFVILEAASNGLSFSVISYLFYTHKKENKERIYKLKYDDSYSSYFIKKVIKCTASFLIVSLGILYYLDQNTIEVQPISYYSIKEKDSIEVTAHRGASAIYPENTIASIRGAINQNADWIEIDIRQTADHHIVLSHNRDLVATADINENIDSLTLEQIKSVDVGWKKSPEFAGEAIPTLEEAIEFAKENNAKLNIEVKVTGYEYKYEQQIVDIIKKYDFEDDCIISSFMLTTLENIKKLDNKLKTASIVAFSEDDKYDLPYIDAYSIDAGCIDKRIVDLVHANNKEIYAWTINTEEKINEMINLGVDSIVTDDVSLAKLLIADREMSSITIKK